MLFFQVSGFGSTTLMWTMTYWLDLWSFIFSIYVEFERTETHLDLLHTVASCFFSCPISSLFHVFHDKAKRTQQGNLLGQTGQTDMIDI